MALLTPSYGPDIEIFRDLCESIGRFAPDDCIHYVVVPRRDVADFSAIARRNSVIWAEEDLVPKSLIPLKMIDSTLHALHLIPANLRLASLNIRHPWPPLRGWVVQQLIKLESTARIEADVVLIVDSDIVFIREFRADQFFCDGAARSYRKDGAIDAAMPRHLEWHIAARRVLGLPQESPPFPDYVSSLTAWDPRVVRLLQQRITETTGRNWITSLGALQQLSEWTLYGVFLDEIVGPPRSIFAPSSTLCHSHWDTEPLDARSAEDFARAVPPNDIAMHIQSKSNTPSAIRRMAIERIAQLQREG